MHTGSRQRNTLVTGNNQIKINETRREDLVLPMSIDSKEGKILKGEELSGSDIYKLRA